MSLRQARSWTPFWIAFGVIFPALVLAGLSIFLSFRMTQAVEEGSARYNRYVAHMVSEGYEEVLFGLVHRAIAPAENVARSGGGEHEIRQALRVRSALLHDPTWFTVDQLMDMTLIVVDGQPVVYTFDPVSRPGRVFAGMLLRGPQGDVLGSGGWWLDPRQLLVANLSEVVDLRMADNPRTYGGTESTRSLSVALMSRSGDEIARIREPAHARTGHLLWLEGPFEGFGVRVTASAGAPVAWLRGVVSFEVALIGLMVLVISTAVVFALRYTAQQLQLAQHKSSFVSNVSHELKTPISLIRLAVETLEMRRISGPQDQERFLRTIGREVDRLGHLVDNILDFARTEAGKREFHFAPTDLAAVTQGVLDSFRPRLEDQGFQTQVSLPPDLPPVRADAHAIGQCLTNLLDNAIKYSRERKEVRVSAEAKDGSVALSVSDRGVGIAERDQRRIFEQFVRLDESLVHEVKGAGVGLALADHIVRAHGGRIEVQSVPGEGSVFTILLPVAGGASVERSRAAVGSG